MAKGKIKKWVSGKGFGFIADDEGGPDVFFHINENKSLEDNKGSLRPDARVSFEKHISRKGPRARNVRLESGSSNARPKSSPQKRHTSRPGLPSQISNSFHNPYTFVPSPPRRNIQQSLFAGDFDPVARGLTHDTLKADLWTGHLPIKLTVVTPLLLLDAADNSENLSTGHQVCNVLDHLPESSLRGMLRNAYETVTNSRYGRFGNNDRLAYRMVPQDALKLVPAVIEKGPKPGALQARLYPGTSQIKVQGPQGQGERDAMYAAMLSLYHRDSRLKSKCAPGYTPKTGDEVWAEIDLQRRQHYSFWKVLAIRPKDDEQTPQTMQGSTRTRCVAGRVLITNENINRKHDERVFFGAQSDTFDVTRLQEAWRMRIQNYRAAHSEDEIFGRAGAKKQPWKKIGNTPGKTAWSPHLYQDGKHSDRWGRNVYDAIELRPGNMVYARCQFDRAGKIAGIEDLFPVMISRELYDASPADLLDDSLHPATARTKLSPADRLFGWTPRRQGEDTGYKGRIRVVCGDGAPDIVHDFGGQSLPLAILGQPKPAQSRFYVARNDKGIPQKDGIMKSQAGYHKGKKSKALRGRKQYWHHKGLEYRQAPDYWQPTVEDRTQCRINGRYQEYRRPNAEDGQPQTDSQNRSVRGWIKPGTVFKATLHVQNLQSEEVGALLWLLLLPSKYYFRLGYGKPLGFGSMDMALDRERYEKDTLPLGRGEDWKRYYAAFDASPPATLDLANQRECLQSFMAGMVSAYQNLLPNAVVTKEHPDQEEKLFEKLSFIQEFLQVLHGPAGTAPIHYPRLDSKPNPQGENFKWFVQNEKNGQRSLPAIADMKGLPYQP